jgi:lipopolysaccharide transport system ATP-binding protein
MPSSQPTQPSAVENVITLSNVGKDFHLSRTGRRGIFGATAAAARIHTAVDSANFTISRGETVALLGTNGAGKSTLLQLITGTLSPTRGHIQVDGRISALLELGAGFNPDWSGRQNSEFQAMIFGAKSSEIPEILARVEAFADIGKFFDQPMKTYSSGMFARVAFAAAIATDPEILIVDEALAVGDSRFQNKCFAHFKSLQERGKTILFVSHDTSMVTQFCTRGIVLDHGQVKFDGSANEAVAAYLKLLYGQPGESVRIPQKKPHANATAAAAPNADAIAKLFAWPPDRDALARRGYYNPHAASAGKVVGQVVDVLLLDCENQPILGPIRSGARFRIAMQIVSEQHIQRPSVGLTLKTKENTLIYGARNMMLGTEVPPLQAGMPLVAVFEIDNHLLTGDYFVDVGLADLQHDEHAVIEWRISLLHLNVTSEVDHYGFVDLGASFAYWRQDAPDTLGAS